MKTDLFCPNCGEKTVWLDYNNGDCNTGSGNLCTNCSYGFGLDYLEDESKNKIVIQRVNKIKGVI